MRPIVDYKKSIVRLISLVFTIAMLIFAYNYISTIIKQADFHNFIIIWPLLALAALLFFAFYILLSIHWLWACKWIDASSSNTQFLVFFASQPYKYLPTSAFTFSFRALYAKKMNLGLKSSSAAQIVENLSLLGSNLAVFFVFYFAGYKLTYGFIALAVLLGAGYAITTVDLQIFRFKNRRIPISAERILKMLSIGSFAWIISGLSFMSLNLALGEAVNVSPYLAANTLAFSLGILSFFSPGGLGVREYVYNLYSVSSIAIISWRLVTFICDMILGMTAIIMLNLCKGRKWML